MTDKARLARGLGLISQGFAELSAAIAVPAEDGAVASGVGAAPSAPAPEPSPFLDEVAPMQRTPTDGLGRCPTHGTAWTIKPAGTSKAGKAYSAFCRCNEQDANGYCSQKPVKGWAEAHPIR